MDCKDSGNVGLECAEVFGYLRLEGAENGPEDSEEE